MTIDRRHGCRRLYRLEPGFPARRPWTGIWLVDHPFSSVKAANWVGLSRFCFATDALFLGALGPKTPASMPSSTWGHAVARPKPIGSTCHGIMSSSHRRSGRGAPRRIVPSITPRARRPMATDRMGSTTAFRPRSSARSTFMARARTTSTAGCSNKSSRAARPLRAGRA